MSKPYDGSAFPLSFDFKLSKVRSKAVFAKQLRNARIYVVAEYEKAINDGDDDFIINLTQFGTRVKQQLLREVIARFPRVYRNYPIHRAADKITNENVNLFADSYCLFKIVLTDE